MLQKCSFALWGIGKVSSGTDRTCLWRWELKTLRIRPLPNSMENIHVSSENRHWGPGAARLSHATQTAPSAPAHLHCADSLSTPKPSCQTASDFCENCHNYIHKLWTEKKNNIYIYFLKKSSIQSFQPNRQLLLKWQLLHVPCYLTPQLYLYTSLSPPLRLTDPEPGTFTAIILPSLISNALSNTGPCWLFLWFCSMFKAICSFLSCCFWSGLQPQEEHLNVCDA